MSSFLQHIVNNIALEPQNLRELKDHCYVFPTKRAGRFFEKALTKRFKGRFLWAPHIFSIEQFTAFLSEKVVLDAVRLVFELFVVYKKEEPTAKFDNFYTWGQIILKDFDEIDKYLVDAEALFSNLKDIKQIDEMFEIPTTELAFLKQFWRVLDKEKNTDIEEEFIRIWEVLGKVYTNFKQQLAEQGAAYDGMAQRELAENLKAGTQKIPFKHIVFAGFNALGRAEEVILTELTSQYNTTVYWDTDVYYMKDKKQEAGKFIRQYYEKWKDNDAHNWISQTNFLGLKTEDNEASLNDSVTKKWHIIGVPLKVGQAKYVGQLLQQDVANKQFSSKDTAIVLGDEGLLFPVLYSLPEEIPAINITMGYPLKDSPLYQLLETIVQLHKTRQESEKLDENTGKPYTQITFYSKFILEILHNPFIKQFAKEEVEKYMHSIERNNLLFIYPETILKHVTHPIFKIIFKKTDHFLGLINGFNDLLVALFTHIKKQHGKETAVDEADLNRKVGEVGVAEEEGEEKKENLELEFIYHMLLNLKKLEEIVRKYRQRLTIDTFWKVFRELIQSAKLPFTGTSVTGLQIMGFLETRTLDFKKLYLMALNEGTIPATKPNNTFVPFNLRKAHNMPTFLDQDAIYGYHFYHLLQRAEEVYLLYNTETNKFSTGERSRFLLQIEEEIANLPDIKVEISHHIITPPLQNDYTIAKRLEIPKNEAIMAHLSRYISDAPEAARPRPMAASPLATYINCPVQFYFKHVANLRELETVDEDINPIIFGNILHKTIELLYKPYKDTLLDAKLIKDLLKDDKKIERNLKQAFKDESFPYPKEGKNLLIKEVIKQLVRKILENDQLDAPFRLVGIESHEYSATITINNNKQIALMGVIDRVDEVPLEDGTPAIRIIDYKTGKIKLNDTAAALKAEPEMYMQRYFDDPMYKAGFQAYFYAYLYWCEQNKDPDIKVLVGVYALREINSGIRYLRKKAIIDATILQAFETKLQNLLNDLFDKNLPFVQTEQPERYMYSPYKDLVDF